MAYNPYAFDGTPISQKTASKFAEGFAKFMQSGAFSTDDEKYKNFVAQQDALEARIRAAIGEREELREAVNVKDERESNPMWGSW